MRLRYWRLRLCLAGIIHRRGSTGNEWRCRVAEWLHGSYEHGSTAIDGETLHERQIRLNYERPPRHAIDDEAKG